MRVKDSLIPKEQQQQAAAGSSSTGQIGGSINSMSFKCQATLPQGHLHSSQETQTLPSRRSSGEKGGLHMNGNCVHTCACCMCIQTNEGVCECEIFTKWLLLVWA